MDGVLGVRPARWRAGRLRRLGPGRRQARRGPRPVVAGAGLGQHGWLLLERHRWRLRSGRRGRWRHGGGLAHRGGRAGPGTWHRRR
ncbi:hypothetical protein GC722_06555 [Auraticoccus sp. F435]|uniref:Uncharacterized protein n=1 Tax=Auraticoccus cholistanensis TaxID=2656650 RepID=A0A6A9URZ4_9ACTN|nr:hypothetical protein [Auraticoccus cholistanensis]MVA75686.1 hypothetical protein [Auraticoccus cholistanensis]